MALAAPPASFDIPTSSGILCSMPEILDPPRSEAMGTAIDQNQRDS